MSGEHIEILTYYGLDGACAAAAVRVRYPDARLNITSAKRVDRSIEELGEEGGREPLQAIYVCGLGVRGDWSRLREGGNRLKARGVDMLWLCGRGYLDVFHERFAAFCTPVFGNSGTNTAAVCGRLGLTRNKRCRELMALARLDANIKESAPRREERCGQQQFWVDLIEAAVSQYFKYQDQSAYKNAIKALASGVAGEEQREQVAVYRRHGAEHALRGKSPQMKRLRERIRLIAGADEHVMVTGESGVGKEYVARLIHEAGPRTMEPMCPVNCAVFEGNEALANSVLFGHVQGAFTGASQDREGAFVAADGGVLFLDEVGEMPLTVQGKFLRVIEDGWVTPVGRDRPVRQVDVRVIAATHCDLPRMVRDGGFREDLFHRLDVLRISVPPLRAHPSDISYIAEYLLRNMDRGRSHKSLNDHEKNALEAYHWPGNVRQLRKVLKRAKLLGMELEDVVEEEKRYLGGDGDPVRFPPVSPEHIMDMRTLQYVYAKQAYMVNGENLSDTARRLNIAVNTLKKYLGA